MKTIFSIKRLLLITISFFAFSYSFSQEWQLINNELDGSETYIRQHTSNSAWIKRTKQDVPLDYDKYGFNKINEGYTVILFRFDCRSLKLGVLVSVYYNNEGEVKHSQQYEDYEVNMNYAVPDSLGEFWLKTFCELGDKSKN
ncbi:hypothetical protein [Psychroserpens damuponensis]|uniref:hypothetical protein n=1 Tax=Psychroserpens damuponensis TaxID=943936 RepID=UPI00058BA401|nr:hypothetical protein [Psychroserpens damuponensis]